MSSPSSAEFSDFPSSPENYPILKELKYFAPRKFLKQDPSLSGDTSLPGPSQSKGTDTPAEDDSEKENPAFDEEPMEENADIENFSPAREKSQEQICETPKSSKIDIRPRILVSQLKSNSSGKRKSKRSFGYSLFTSKRCCRPNVCKMQAERKSSDSGSD